MRKPSLLMVCCALTLTLVGCTTSNQNETEEAENKPAETEQRTEAPAETPKDTEDEVVEDAPTSEAEPPKEDEPAEEPAADEPETEEAPVAEAPPVEEPAQTPSEPLEQNGTANVKLDTLILVNKQIALPAGYKPKDLVTANIDFVDTATGERKMLRQEAARAIEKLMTGAKAANIELKGTSAFRSYDYQVQLFNNYVARDGKAQAMKYSAPPGHSEHQTGLAIDVSSASVGYQLTQSLEQTKEGKWLADNAHTYGFIVRYQRAYEAETGYMFEPWHLRYIGVEHATNVHKTNVPLERYLEQLMD
ncbi:D-alanyl-D-alanine carboxypeptidase family protein [Exiguobacterium sp. SL-9]|uniref:M15 family metallopeptidase n=1 Tax=Exiguobacterium sp. SL-9 TaxID=2510963 RepID=UPI00103D3BFF|nr:M15 family metallopeptidase [Exiguobacterium sp. SL-9]TCI21924.1 D-alanyl-D-alanine carboxypeptidase family protein [Exiguobacterium sp. SL-9]